MKNLFKKILACCMVVCMVLTLCVGAVTASAADFDGTFTIVAGKITTADTEAVVKYTAQAGCGIAAAEINVAVPANLSITKLELVADDTAVEVTYAKAEDPQGAAAVLMTTNNASISTVAPYVNDGVFTYIIHMPAGKTIAVPVTVKVTYAGTFEVGSIPLTADVESCKDATSDLLNLEVVEGAINVATHEHNYVGEVTTQPTCTEPGVKTFTCTCGEGTYTQSIDALDHAWGEGEVTTAPDCDDAGVRTYTCANDPSHTKTEAIDALGHTAVPNAAVPATCTTVGYTGGTHCDVCGAVIEAATEVPALGHTILYSDGDDEDHHTKYCSKCDYSEQEEHNYVDGECVCGAVEFVPVAAIADVQYSSLVEALEYANDSAIIESNKITVQLLKNVVLDSNVTVADAVTLNMGSYTITNGDYKVELVGNGCVKSTNNNLSSMFVAQSAVTLSTKSGVTTYQQSVRVGLYRKTLNLSSEISMNYYFLIKNDSGLTVVNRGLLQWTEAEYNTIDSATYDEQYYIGELESASGDYWKLKGKPIPAKNMIDTYYARAYAVLSDGTYIYGKVVRYNIQDFAISTLNSSTAEEKMPIIVAVLDYGTAAQINKEYRQDKLLNSCLTKEQLERYRTTTYDDSLKAVAASEKQVKGYKGDYTWYNPSVNLGGALMIKFYTKKYKTLPTGATKIGMVYWTREQYAEAGEDLDPSVATELSVENNNGYYQGNVENIVAKQIYDVYYASYYIEDANGVRTYSPVYACSVASYVSTKIDDSNSSESLVELAKQILVYGQAARTYFNYE